MANRHEVTVHIWPNTEAFEIWLAGPRRAKRPDNFVSGHAAMKLQKVNANKGDYYYVSMLPNHGEVHIDGEKFNPRDVHSMAMRYGQGSQSQALMLPQEEQKLFQTSDINILDKVLFKGKAKTTYRFTGPDFTLMVAFVKQLVTQHQKWDMYNYNCAQAVADCLKAGGAPSPPTYEHFTPNQVGTWCEALCKRYAGSEIKTDGNVQVVS